LVAQLPAAQVDPRALENVGPVALAKLQPQMHPHLRLPQHQLLRRAGGVVAAAAPVPIRR
jgi:hypothetical protein